MRRNSRKTNGGLLSRSKTGVFAAIWPINSPGGTEKRKENRTMRYSTRTVTEVETRTVACTPHGNFFLLFSSTIILPVCTRCTGVETLPSCGSDGGWRGMLCERLVRRRRQRRRRGMERIARHTPALHFIARRGFDRFT